MSDSDGGASGHAPSQSLRFNRVSAFIKTLRSLGVMQFACPEFQVSFECPHGQKEDSDMRQIGFHAPPSSGDDDQD